MYLSAILLGLLGGLHCIGMCGPIAFMLPVDHNNSLKKAGQISLYHLGRLLSYAIIGIIFGTIGKSATIFGLQQKLSIIIGISMIIIILLPKKKLYQYSGGTFLFKSIGKLKSSIGKEFKKKSPDMFFTIGFLNGFLPCGVVYIAVLGAIATSNPLYGGIYMFLFGLGTTPLMTIIVYFKNLCKGQMRSKLLKIIPIFVIIIGILFVLRGLGLGIPYVSPKTPSLELATGRIECNP